MQLVVLPAGLLGLRRQPLGESVHDRPDLTVDTGQVASRLPVTCRHDVRGLLLGGPQQRFDRALCPLHLFGGGGELTLDVGTGLGQQPFDLGSREGLPALFLLDQLRGPGTGLGEDRLGFGGRLVTDLRGLGDRRVEMGARRPVSLGEAVLLHLFEAGIGLGLFAPGRHQRLVHLSPGLGAEERGFLPGLVGLGLRGVENLRGLFAHARQDLLALLASGLHEHGGLFAGVPDQSAGLGSGVETRGLGLLLQLGRLGMQGHRLGTQLGGLGLDLLGFVGGSTGLALGLLGQLFCHFLCALQHQGCLGSRANQGASPRRKPVPNFHVRIMSDAASTLMPSARLLSGFFRPSSDRVPAQTRWSRDAGS